MTRRARADRRRRGRRGISNLTGADVPLSVVMPARNVGRHLDASLESILGQSFGDFEFIIRDDGSTDGTREALRDWARRDRRIRLFEGPQLGLAESSNWVVRQARAPLIARMDADDVARGDRLQRQFDLMRSAPDIALCASLCDTIDGEGRRMRQFERWRLTRRSCFVPFPHTSVMFRRSAFDAVGGYRRECEYWEDLDFFLRIVARGKIAVIADDLVSHRQSQASSRVVPADQERIEAAVDRMYDCLAVRAAGGDYEPMVAAGEGAPQPRRVQPMSIVSIHSNRLWAGERPRIFGRLLRRGKLGLNGRSMLALGWAAAAQLSPPALRAMLKAMVLARNFAARGRIRRGEVYDWRPHLTSQAEHERQPQPLPRRLSVR